MRIVHVSSSDSRGGAARAAQRLHTALLESGVDSHLLVEHRETSLPFVYRPANWFGLARSIVAWRLDQARVRRGQGSAPGLFSPAWLPDQLRGRLAALRPDVVNLHWINSGFVRLETLGRLEVPLVWTLHDMWPFTGGCHYTGGCSRYEQACGQCPQLGSHKDRDLSRQIWLRKRNSWSGLKLHLVAPSGWMAAKARSSSLFREKSLSVIANGLDTRIFKPLDPRNARVALDLPIDKKILLFGAETGTTDPRKGFDLLSEALKSLARHGPECADTCLAVFGDGCPRRGEMYGMSVVYFGTLRDDVALALLYSAADALVLPSREDNLPCTVQEAMACGTPCVAFRTGGLQDLVTPGETGWLAEPFQAEALADGLRRILQLPSSARDEIKARARARAEAEFSITRQAARYHELYRCDLGT